VVPSTNDNNKKKKDRRQDKNHFFSQASLEPNPTSSAITTLPPWERGQANSANATLIEAQRIESAAINLSYQPSKGRTRKERSKAKQSKANYCAGHNSAALYLSQLQLLSSVR